MISLSYKKILNTIHRETPFGKRSKIPCHLKGFIDSNVPKSILDFGCGKGRLLETLKENYKNIQLFGYDPGNPIFDREITPVDMIISTDVLEHIEPEHIADTIAMLGTKARFHYHLISCAPAKLILPDGRNAHLIQETPEWWRHQFENNGYTILSDDYKEFEKYSKQLRKNIPVKNYYVMLRS